MYALVKKRRVVHSSATKRAMPPEFGENGE